MGDELNDSLLEKLGPVVLRLLALVSVASIAIPIALVALLPFYG
jgi:hypothetical protein